MKISNNKFANEEVVLDFHEYNTCEFTNCRFVILGYGAFSLNQCEVKNCEFTFAGPAASVIQTMATIYTSAIRGKTSSKAPSSRSATRPAASRPDLESKPEHLIAAGLIEARRFFFP